MQPLEVLEVILLDLSDFVVLQVEQSGVVRDVFRDGFKTWWKNSGIFTGKFKEHKHTSPVFYGNNMSASGS